MAITAAQVKELRERTGVGMMECKKALEAANGDIEKAIDEMRKSGLAKAAKKAGRTAAEGAVVIAEQGQEIAIVEVNCETDFVGRDASFLAFAKQVADNALAHKTQEVKELLATTAGATTLDEVRAGLVAKIGENINVRRCVLITAVDQVGSYLHNDKIGVVVSLTGGDANLARDIAMHIAASKPEVINPDEVDAEKIAREKEIFMAQAAESGKPADIVEKMVEGKIKKFLNDVSLVGQAFIKNPDITVGALLKQHNAKVTHFTRFEVGEGIEKQEVDFRTEVMAQVKGTA